MSASLAFVFPGQGSQSLGMLAELGAQQALVRDTFGEASEALGYDLWALTQQGPEERLNETDKTQPAILTASIALWRLWQAEGGARPAFVAGHSLGEYSALVAAGAIGFRDAVKLVELRGQLMQQAVPAGQGGMAAILGLEDADVLAACAEAAQGEVVSAVNFNAPGQVVIAGAAAAVERAIEACKARGAKRAMPLPISVPSHCELMRPAAEKFADAVNGLAWQAPQIPLVQNVSAAVPADLDVLKRPAGPAVQPGALGGKRDLPGSARRLRAGRMRPRQSAGGPQQALCQRYQHPQSGNPGRLRRRACGAGLSTRRAS